MRDDHKLLCKLDDLGTLARGKSKHRPRNDPDLYGGKYPFIQTGDVKHADFYITSYTQTYNEKGLSQSKLWKPGVLCITIAANIADTAILKIPACFPDSILGFISNKDKADIKFVKYCLDTYKVQIQTISHGTTQDNLSLEKLKSIKFNTPPLTTQKKIAAILSAYDELIENNKRRISLLEKMAEEIYREWFVRFRFPGYEKAKFKKGMPEGWEIKKIKEFASFLYGYTESACLDDSLPKFLRVTDINKSSYVSWKDVPNCPISDLDLDKYKLAAEDIVIARMADPGKIAIIEKNINAVFASYLIKIAYRKDIVTPYFLFYTLRSDYYAGLFSNADSGATRGSVNAQVIGGTPILLPPNKLMQKFNDIISGFRNQINILNDSIEKLEYTKNMLLPRLISGKLSVEHLDIQFPPDMQEEDAA